MRGWRTKSGKFVTVHSNADVLMPWRQAIAAVAATCWPGEPTVLPVSLTIIFHMRKPKSARKAATWPITRPDVDKLARAVLDAIDGVCYGDDSQVVYICAVKEYAATPKAIITVKEMGA